METSPPLPETATALGISFDGRAYHYASHTYERLADALAYARIDRARAGLGTESAPRRWPQWSGPAPDDRIRMAAHGIAYESGYYWYGPYRYEQLAAAIDYAGRAPGLAPVRRAEGKELGGEEHR
jgi:uncharacterized protein (DUF433 family)